jgi:hypothetical protein
MKTIAKQNMGNQAQPNTRPLPTKARELLQDQQAGLLVWIRPPKQGVEFYSGFSRSKLYELAGKGEIRSVSIREPGAIKGTRLFRLSSVLDFIAKCEESMRTSDAKESLEGTNNQLN